MRDISKWLVGGALIVVLVLGFLIGQSNKGFIGEKVQLFPEEPEQEWSTTYKGTLKDIVGIGVTPENELLVCVTLYIYHGRNRYKCFGVLDFSSRETTSPFDLMFFEHGTTYAVTVTHYTGTRLPRLTLQPAASYETMKKLGLSGEGG